MNVATEPRPFQWHLAAWTRYVIRFEVTADELYTEMCAFARRSQLELPGELLVLVRNASIIGLDHAELVTLLEAT